MGSKNIGLHVHYIPVHFHFYNKQLGFKEWDFRLSEKFYSEIISIPVYLSFFTSQLQTVIDILKEN